MNRPNHSAWLAICLFVFAASAEAAEAVLPTTGLPPELQATEVHSLFGMVATGSPEATQSAVGILEQGGNAVDAAVAAALVLGVSDSDASGLGGMTYMVIRLAGGHAVAIDGTAQAPGFLDLEALRAAKMEDREFGYETVAVPTTLAVLALALDTYGTISMAEALQPAIEVATLGYHLSPIQIAWTRAYHEEMVVASDYLRFLVMKDGTTIGEPGELFCNHDLAGTLREIARNGVDSFYRGPIAARIEADMVKNGGFVRRGDLAMVRVHRVSPMTTTYRGVEVLTVPPPGGGDSLVGVLDILETFSAALLAEDSLARHHVFIESARIGLAARANAGAGLLIASGLPAIQGQRKAQAPVLAQMIVPGTALPKNVISGPVNPDCLPDGESTTQVSIIDAAGNVVSLTQTLGQSYGSKVATPGLGFIYNNFLSSFRVDKPQCPAFLRPRGPCPNDMAPTILVHEGGRVLALGTPGSSRIPSILSTVISNMLDRGMGLGAAIEAPRILWEGGKDMRICAEIAGPLTDADVDAFHAMGYENPVDALHFPAPPVDLADFGGVNAVAFDPASATYTGVVDPRRGGLALGPRVVAAND